MAGGLPAGVDKMGEQRPGIGINVAEPLGVPLERPEEGMLRQVHGLHNAVVGVGHHLQAMAQLCEIRGDIPGALAAKREEADRIENQWHITGEELDCVLRDIQRLEKKLDK